MTVPLNPAPLQIVAALALCSPMSWGATSAQGVGAGVGRGVGTGVERGVGAAVRRGVGLGVATGADEATPPGATGVPLGLAATAVAAKDGDAGDPMGASAAPAARDGSADGVAAVPVSSGAAGVPVAPATSPSARNGLLILSASTETATAATTRTT